MNSISIVPGKNNVGAYINNINLNKLDQNIIQTKGELFLSMRRMFMILLGLQLQILFMKVVNGMV